MCNCRGELAAGQSVQLQVTYTPSTSSMFSCETFLVSIPGSQSIPLTIKGTALAPAVSLSAMCLSFGSLPPGQTASKAFYVQNDSDVPALYEFVADAHAEAHGVFSFDKVRGSVAPGTAMHVTVTFCPTEAANYWRSVTCLVRVSLHA